jgi:SAM-dependent methyltransferase
MMRLKQFLRDLFSYPLTRGYDIDDPQLTDLRRTILREKRFLNCLYNDWYNMIVKNIPEGPGKVLELGSGAGFFNDIFPEAIQSEIFWLPHLNITLDGQLLPFANHSLKSIIMSDVLHHIPNPRRFFSEANRCLRQDGVVVMIEPWYTPWSNWVYKNLHHEPFDHQVTEWEFPSTGPLSGANGALPWIIFERDITLFHQEFPQLSIQVKEPMMPITYLISGGVSMRSFAPASTYPIWRKGESLLNPWMDKFGMFALIVLRNNLAQ